MHILKTGAFQIQKGQISLYLPSLDLGRGKIYFPAHLDRATTGAFGHVLAKRTYLYHIT